MAGKTPAQVCLIRKPGFVCGFRDRMALTQDQTAGLRQAKRTQILTHRAAVVAAKNSCQMNRMDSHFVCDPAHSQRRTKSTMKKFARAPQPQRASERLMTGRSIDQGIENLQYPHLDVRVCPQIRLKGDR